METKEEAKREEEESANYTEFRAQADVLGRISIPPHIRRRLGIYKEAAEVSVKVEVEKIYGDNKEK